MIAINDITAQVFQLSLNENLWLANNVGYFESEAFMFYLSYIFLPIWSVIYTFGGDICGIDMVLSKKLCLNSILNRFDGCSDRIRARSST